MQDRFDDKPLKAEVIDMDRATKARKRPSNLYTERVETAIGSGPDDPGYRYLFDDPEDRDPRRGPRVFRTLGSLALTFVIAMGSAWVVWSMPGLGPQQNHAQLLQRLHASESRMIELESQLAQAQARVIELARSVEIQHGLIDQGESLRRSMTTTLENLSENSQRLVDAQAASAKRLESLEVASRAQASTLRRQAESVEGLDQALVDGLTRVRFANEKLERRLTETRREIEQNQRDQHFELTRFVQEELTALRQGDLNDMRGRVERLATHVWKEVGRLDGRIVRVAHIPEENPVR